MANQLVTARVIVPDCPDWQEAEMIVKMILESYRLDVEAVKWEETLEEDTDH